MCTGSTLFTHIRMRTSRLAFLYSVPTAVLSRLIALGGVEFLFPALAWPLGRSARRATTLNPAVNLIGY
jgi:hypothetical protein